MAVTPLRRPVDAWTLAYLGVASAALSLRPSPGRSTAALLWLAHAALAGTALALAPRARGAGPVGRFVGEFYPLLAVFALYTEVGLLNGAAGVSHDGLVQAWERALFAGSQPSRDWIRAWPWPAFSSLMHLGYLSYYVVLAGAPLGLWLTGRRDGARRVHLLMMVTFYVCYAIFLVFPVAGPRYVLPLVDNAAARTPVARLTHALVAGGSAWGTAFPSSHVAVSLVASVAALRQWRALGSVLLVATALLAFGTVYGQFHYAVDALAGVAIGALVLAAAGRDRPGPAAPPR
jgi:membrane-associated phospholipid phosphatase